jgi:hypothetical protein
VTLNLGMFYDSSNSVYNSDKKFLSDINSTLLSLKTNHDIVDTVVATGREIKSRQGSML